MREGAPEDLAAKLPTEAAEAGAEAPWRYNQATALSVDCSKATSELGLKLKDPSESVRDLCANSVFQSLVRGASA